MSDLEAADSGKTDRIGALIVDDEQLARDRLVRLLATEQDVHVCGQAATGSEAVAAIRRHRPDVVFLDIRMPGLDGFEALSSLRDDEIPWIVFVTAFPEYAARAFDVPAIDYLVKPVVAERLRRTLDRIRQQRSDRPAPGHSRLRRLLDRLHSDHEALKEVLERTPSAHGTRLLLRDGSRTRFVKTSEIDWIGAEGNYVSVHVGKTTHLVRTSLGELEATLDPDRFARVHRSTIVNLDRIDRLSPSHAGAYTVLLIDGTELSLSRGYRDRLFARMGKVL
jgi:two-component system LytT family response regulator